MLAMTAGAIAPARATTFVRMDAGDLAARASAAVIGTVTAVRGEQDADGSLATVVVIDPDRVVRGSVPPGPLILHERGGAVAGRAERVFGSAQYRVGERVLTFVSLGAAGRWHTTAMAMGKYELTRNGIGTELATRTFDGEVAVLDPAAGRLDTGGKIEVEALAAVLERMRGLPATPTKPSLYRGRVVPHGNGAGFTYLGDPSRWFEPDDGAPIVFDIDPSGDAALGPDVSDAAAVAALNAWTNVADTALVLRDEPLDAVQPFAGCDGPTRIVFNDPFDEMDPPIDCRGVLGIGGYCYSDEHRTIQDVSFARIGLGKVTIGKGWGDCPFWNACNLGQVITHEVGHAIGLGHSTDPSATMAATAQFDGRCAAVAADDEAAVRFVYPTPVTPVPRPTRTAAPASPTRSPTAPPRPTSTRRPRGTLTVSGRIEYYGSGLPIAGVSVILRAPNALQYGGTEANGQYAFNDLLAESWTLEPAKSGAIGGAVSALDAAWALQAADGSRQLSADQRLACDVTGDDRVNDLDALRILQFAVGDLPRLPVGTQCSSDWLFIPSPAPLTGQEVMMPAVDAQSCRRGAILLDALQSDAPREDFQALIFGDCTANWSDPAAGATTATAPLGTAIDLLPLRHRPGGRWLQPIGVRAPGPVRALDIDLRFDSTLQFDRVRRVRSVGRSLAYGRSPQAGRALITLASAVPLVADGRAVIVVELRSPNRTVSPNAVRMMSAAVDERVLP